MKIRLLLAACLLAQLSFAQTKEEDPEYTEEMALYKAKEFAAFELLDRSSDSITRFILHPLEAGESAEMTTLYFKCESQGKEGLLLGFNGEQKTTMAEARRLLTSTTYPKRKPSISSTALSAYLNGKTISSPMKKIKITDSFNLGNSKLSSMKEAIKASASSGMALILTGNWMNVRIP